MKNNKRGIVLAVVAALAAGAGGGYWFAMQNGSVTEEKTAETERKPLFYRNPMNPAITSPVPAKDEMGMDYIPVYAEDEKPKERKPLFYRNPMNPAITSPVPAKDEMGMDYIPVYADDEGGSGEPAGTVKIDPVTVQNIGVRTARVTRGTLAHNVRAVGRIDYDETRLARLHPKTEGWVESMRVERTGERVHRDTILLSIYSPQLVSGQEEYLLALKNRDTLAKSPFEDIRRGAEELVKSARKRLELLDMPAHQIRELEQTGRIKKKIHIHSPFAGVITHVGVREGQFVKPDTELYRLADLSRVWVLAEVYEYELPWIREGDSARMSVAALPGQIFEGRVSYIYPYMEAKTRTVRVRLEFDNPDGVLRPEMFANVTVAAGPVRQALLVPSEAIVRSGKREMLFVVREPGKFEPREVTLGLSSDGFTQVLEGVKEGEEVVISAQFLIDSESKLREATAKMMEALSQGGGSTDAEMDMSDMSLDEEMNMDDMSLDGGDQP